MRLYCIGAVHSSWWRLALNAVAVSGGDETLLAVISTLSASVNRMSDRRSASVNMEPTAVLHILMLEFDLHNSDKPCLGLEMQPNHL